MNVSRSIIAGFACLLLAACDPQPPQGGTEPDRTALATAAEPNEILAGVDRGQDSRGFVPIGDQFVEIPYENVDGYAVFGGDMIIGRHADVQQVTAIFREAARQGRKASDLARDGAGLVSGDAAVRSALARILGTGPAGRRWPTKAIPYRLDASITDADLKTRIARAIADWNATGLVSFVPEADASDATKQKTNTLIFRDAKGDEFSCSAAVGHQATRSEQTISLNPAWGGAAPNRKGKHGGCRRGSIVHEIGHALGLYHEHMRSNRSTYLKVASTISDDDDNYGVLTAAEQHTDYDLCSIMHYSDTKDGAQWFELTDTGKTELAACRQTLANQSSDCTAVGQRCQLSPRDVGAIRTRMANAADS